MTVIDDYTGTGATGMPYRTLIIEHQDKAYDVAYYPDHHENMSWGAIYNDRNGRKIRHSSETGQAVLAAARKHVAEGVAV